MEIIIVNGCEKLIVHKDEECPICGSLLKDVAFTWRMFHGEAYSSCCQAIYQIKDFYIENPTKEQKNFLAMLAGDYYQLKIYSHWIEPLKKAMKQLKSNYLSDAVIHLAGEFVNNKKEKQS